jgi:protein-L-isoaspartate(D-aspartate) O-methyltransferase
MINENEIIVRKEKLINELVRKGISDLKVLETIRKVPRELFLSDDLVERAYEDNALPISCGQTISQPYTVAFMTSLLDVLPGSRILEIGTGCGYQAAILAELGAVVYSIETLPDLFELSKTNLSELGYSVYQIIGDGTIGWIEEAPFDRIIVTAGAPETPIELLNQLKVGGKMVIPIGDRFIQKMHLIEKLSSSTFRTTHHHEFRFVPLIGKFGWQS